jgi:hypothetical protein
VQRRGKFFTQRRHLNFVQTIVTRFVIEERVPPPPLWSVWWQWCVPFVKPFFFWLLACPGLLYACK